MRHLRKWLLCAAALVAFLACVNVGSAHASTVYTYTGNKFVSIVDVNPPTGTYTTSMSVSGFVELANPLAANFDIAFEFFRTADLLDFSFSDGRNTLTKATAVGADINFGTDGSGVITSWRMNVEDVRPSKSLMIGEQRSFISTRSASFGDLGIIQECRTLDSDGDCFYHPADTGSVSASLRGTWQVFTVSAVPLPAAFPLFGTGLGLLGFLGWRRRRKAQAV